MIPPDTLFVFVAACLAVNATPGPSVLYVTTMSMARGQKAGIYAALGLNAGIAVHVLAAACGVSTILASSAVAFALIRYVGAAYLVYLGVTMILSGTRHEKSERSGEHVQTLRQAILIDLLNPKVALFFLAFLPQFVDVSRGSLFSQIIVLGIVFITTGTIVNCIYAILASQAARRINPGRFSFAAKLIPGSILIALGVRLAWQQR